MLLNAGDRLGPYEIVAALGAGGMGEVYRARDPRIGREVAIKVSTERFSQRFEREARAIATLNHPNICTLYDVGPNYLVLELVEGDSPTGAHPLAYALRSARQIAEALEAAHQKGIIHRDLKPSNIKIKLDGVVKVLDFGLAKLPEGCDGVAPSNAEAWSLSTDTVAPQASAVMGTAAYMPPEQARGEPVDKRADIWAFGAVLYQMLTGRRAFPGESIVEVLAAVAHAEPDWSALPSSTPPSIRRLLKRALEKDLPRRLPDIGVARLEIDDALALDSSDAAAAPRSQRAMTWLVLGGGIVAALAFGLVGPSVWHARSQDPTSLSITRFSVTLDPRASESLQFPIISVSPDGKQIIHANTQGLYVRAMSERQGRYIFGTDTATGGAPSNPVFSPDGQEIAFFSLDGSTGGAIKRIAVTGGSAVALLPIDWPPYGMTWGADGLLFARSFGQGPWGVYRLSPRGGAAELLIPTHNEFVHGPQMLPDRHTVLMTVATGTAADRWDNARIVAYSIKSGERRTLIEGGSDARYLPTGHIVYIRKNTLWAVPFDVSRLQVVGKPIPVVDEVGEDPMQGAASGAAQFAVSATGSLVYVRQPSTLWGFGQVDRRGAVRPLSLPPGPYQYPRLSRDGTRIAASTDRGEEAIVWVGELAGGGSLRRLTFSGRNRFPIWSADGQRVTFQSDRDGDLSIFWQRADGTGTPERLTTALPGTAHVPESWSPAGDHLLFRINQGSTFSLWTLSVKDGKAAPFGAVESSVPPNAVFSPDGRWVAYMSHDVNQFLISVQPFPATGTKYQVVEGGVFPLWSRDGREIFYFHGKGQFAVVRVLPQPGFTVSTPVELWTERATQVLMAGTAPHRGLDPTPDGKFVSLITVSPDHFPAATEIQVVLNWFDDLKQRVPVPH